MQWRPRHSRVPVQYYNLIYPVVALLQPLPPQLLLFYATVAPLNCHGPQLTSSSVLNAAP